jgi:hypothetical protein
VLSEFYYEKTAFIKATGEGSSLWFSFYLKKTGTKSKIKRTLSNKVDTITWFKQKQLSRDHSPNSHATSNLLQIKKT